MKNTIERRIKLLKGRFSKTIFFNTKQRIRDDNPNSKYFKQQ